MATPDLTSVRASLAEERTDLDTRLSELTTDGSSAPDFDENFADSAQVAAEKDENLSLGDLDLDAGLVRVFGKGAKERIVPLGRHAIVALVAWLAPEGRGELEPDRWASRGDAEAVFLNRRGGRLSRQGAWAVVRAAGERVGLAGRLTPHVLRHSCATHMLDHGADIRTVQELLGHASISTTQVYTMVSAERLRAVYRTAHPRAVAE